MRDQLRADAAALLAGQDVGVADQVDVSHRLDTHHAEQHAIHFITPEFDPGGDLAVELPRRHVWLVPAIVGNHAPVRLGSGLDDREYRRALVVATAPDDRRRDAFGGCRGNFALVGVDDGVLHVLHSCRLDGCKPDDTDAGGLGQKCGRGINRQRRRSGSAYAELPGETAGQVALVEKAGNRRRLGQRMAVANEPARQSDPPLQDVSMRRQPQLARKAAKQLVATEPGLVGQACQHQRRGRVVIDPVADLADGSHRPRRRHSAARRIGLHARSQAQERRLAGHRIARSARRHMGEDVIEKPAQSLVLEYRCGECQRYVGAVVDIVQDVAQQLGIDIQHPPRPRLSMDCAAVMDFARVHENQAARPGFDLTPAARRCMSAGVDDTNAVLVVRVARIAARRGCRHRVDAGQRETVVEDTLAHRHSRGLRRLGPREPDRRRLATVLKRCRAPASSTPSGNCAAAGRRTA